MSYKLIYQTSEKPKIDLVIEMETMEEVHPMLEGIIMDAALKAVDGLLAKVRLEITCSVKFHFREVISIFFHSAWVAPSTNGC